MSKFISVFAPKLEAMLEYREAFGYKRKTYLPSLIKFDSYCKEQMLEEPDLTSEIVYDWLEFETDRNFFNRTMAIRQFGKYLNAVGELAFILPHKSTTIRQPSTPYIFTDDELAALFAAIDKLTPTQNEPFLAEIVHVLFRLTYTCGLRPNESRNLKCENINLESGEILITDTKKNKERIVVMSDDMRLLCYKYDLRRRIFSESNPYFFPSTSGGALTSTTIYKSFVKAWKSCATNIDNPLVKSVRVYDLRHRFASTCLNNWLDEGENLMTMLPYLRTYMGHNSLDDTAYYIHILPERIVKNSAIDWNAFNSMFPELSTNSNTQESNNEGVTSR